MEVPLDRAPPTRGGNAKFIGGPLDGQRHRVPDHGPAFVRYRGTAYYAHRRGTLRTYTYIDPVAKLDQELLNSNTLEAAERLYRAGMR